MMQRPAGILRLANTPYPCIEDFFTIQSTFGGSVRCAEGRPDVGGLRICFVDEAKTLSTWYGQSQRTFCVRSMSGVVPDVCGPYACSSPQVESCESDRSFDVLVVTKTLCGCKHVHTLTGVSSCLPFTDFYLTSNLAAEEEVESWCGVRRSSASRLCRRTARIGRNFFHTIGS